MSFLQNFIDQYKIINAPKKVQFDDSLMGKLKKLAHLLSHDDFAPSSELLKALDKLKIRGVEPMKIAITGQFSSGKSTFLNALLAKNILPTGITPVTSKVNYIRYGEEFQIKVRYHDGREEYHSMEGLSRFTDQRQNGEDVEFLTIYAPLELLKDIVFVDTPGLNSQAQTDTKTTQKVLKEVDGIIWLTLIDNAGKMSEAEVLKSYMNSFAQKSLCVLNQKDKFSQEQIEQTSSYVKEAFKEFFSSVVPISALQALKARSHDSRHQMDELLENYIEDIKKQAKLPVSMVESQKMEDLLKDFKTKARKIYKADNKENAQLLKSSNINAVLDFIHTQIQPKASQTKRYAISKEAQDICDKLITSQENIITIYTQLEEILQEFEQRAQDRFEELKTRFSKQIKDAYLKIENIIEKTASEIFNQIKTEEKIRYMKNKTGVLKKQISYQQVSYEVSKIHTDVVYKKLFYDEDLIGKMFKKYVRNLKLIQDEVNHENELIYKDLESKILKWQHPYELIRKSEPIHSDAEFANVRKFASKVYENFLKSFNDEIKISYAGICSQFNHLSSAVSFNYQNATEVCVAFLEHKINESIELYEENPTQFPLYSPNLDEIKHRLRVSFHLYELENLMNSKNTFLDKDYKNLMEKFQQIQAQKIKFLRSKIKNHQRKIEKLQKIKKIFQT
ncbi:MAG: dynamin [Proteobacteria bacterium]|nr:MAG: dynamin [Pseudomonadota bacterium]